MKKMLAVIAALAGVGCVEVERHEFDELAASMKNLEIKTKNQNDLSVHLYNELVQKHGALALQVSELERTSKAMQSSVARLEDDVKAILAGIKGGTSPYPIPPVDPDAKIKIDEILLLVETTLGNLRQGKLEPERAAVQLRPYAKHAAPRVLDELAGATTKIDYSNQLELILARFPPADLKVPLQKALTQRGLRESAARVAGQTKDPELGKILEEHANSADEDYRLVVGESLVQCRNAKGIPILVVSLRSPVVETRTIAIAALKRLNRGQDLSYRATLSNEQNAPAIKEWEVWAENFGKKIFD